MNERTRQEIRTWAARLTGLPEESFEGLTFEQKVEELLKWHAAKVIGEQMSVLILALILTEDETNHTTVAKYLGSREVTDRKEGRFAFVTGLCELPNHVINGFLPMLKAGGYRPHLRADTSRMFVRLMGKLSERSVSLQPGDFADAILLRRMSPYMTRKAVKLLEGFAERHPDGLQAALEAVSVARSEAVDVIADKDHLADRLPDPDAPS